MFRAPADEEWEKDVGGEEVEEEGEERWEEECLWRGLVERRIMEGGNRRVFTLRSELPELMLMWRVGRIWWDGERW